MKISSQKLAPKNRPVEGKILVIEDSLDQCLIIQKAFEQVNPQIQPVLTTNGDEAFTVLEDFVQTEADIPRLILLDLYLPSRQDGWRALERIQTLLLPTTKQVPVVIMSSSGDLEDVIDAYQQGIRSYVVKPKTFTEWLNCCKILGDYLYG